MFMAWSTSALARRRKRNWRGPLLAGQPPAMHGEGDQRSSMTAVLLQLAEQLYARAEVRAGFAALMNGAVSRPDSFSSVDEVERQADWLAGAFRARSMRPCRCGIDGLPGSGKSTLARALAKPVAHSKAKLRARGRGEYLLRIMDHERLKRVGRKAFAAALGESLTVPNSFVRVKLRPAGGFRIRDLVRRELSELGRATEGLSQEQLLFLASENHPGHGLLAYVDGEACAEQLVEALCRALRDRAPKTADSNRCPCELRR